MKQAYGPILFFGSGPVAAKSLKQLSELFSIEAVITKPAHAHHHGSVPVLALAHSLGLPTHTTLNKSELTAFFSTHTFKSRLAVLVDFGIIIPPEIIDRFPLGIVNSHFSLLPQLRGPDPITFAILTGQKKTGVSLMLLVEAMDEGPLLAQSPYILPADVTGPERTTTLIEISNHTLETILPLYISGEVSAIPQDTSLKPTYSKKLVKEDGLIDWQKPASQIEREIRAFIEWPKSHTTINNTPVIITKAHIAEQSGKPGEVITANKVIRVFCGQQSLIIDRLKPISKKEMTGSAFLAGYK